MLVQEVTSAELQQLIDTETAPLLIDFFATWCGPCKAMAPALEAFAAENPDLKVVKVDVDVCQDMARKFQLRSVPTLVLLQEGRVLGAKIGSQNLANLRDWLRAARH